MQNSYIISCVGGRKFIFHAFVLIQYNVRGNVDMVDIISDVGLPCQNHNKCVPFAKIILYKPDTQCNNKIIKIVSTF